MQNTTDSEIELKGRPEGPGGNISARLGLNTPAKIPAICSSHRGDLSGQIGNLEQKTNFLLTYLFHVVVSVK
jgi:hypothetical protein